MRLLLIAPQIDDLASVKNFSGVWSYYLSREFRRMGIELRFDAPLHNADISTEKLLAHYRTLDLAGIDHVLALGTRYFTRVHPACASIVRDRLGGGAVTQVHDTPVSGGSVDCTFTLGEGKARPKEKSHLVGWAADPELCFPQQDEKTLGILVDHTDYVKRKGDRTNEILDSARAFIASGMWRERFQAAKLWRITDGGIVEDDGSKAELYRRQAIPFTEACSYYGRAHIFCVTHPESVGLTVLEAAMSGAMPLLPKKYIPKDRLATVRHLKYATDIPWAQAVREWQPRTSRKRAMQNTWDRVAGSIVTWLKAYRK